MGGFWHAECQNTRDYNSSPKPNKSSIKHIICIGAGLKVTGIALGSVIATYLALFLALGIFSFYAKYWESGWLGEWRNSTFWNYQLGKIGWRE